MIYRYRPRMIRAALLAVEVAADKPGLVSLRALPDGTLTFAASNNDGRPCEISIAPAEAKP